jgi:transcriptional regulator with GAF, ATPase, and Fis domain
LTEVRNHHIIKYDNKGVLFNNMLLAQITERLSGITRWRPLLQNLFDVLEPYCTAIHFKGDELMYLIDSSGFHPFRAMEEVSDILIFSLKPGRKCEFSFCFTECVLSPSELSLLGDVLKICSAAIVTTKRLRNVSHDAWEKITLSQEASPESSSDIMNDCIKKARLVAPFVTPVLLQGESGTGKEVLANFIHRISERRTKPFIVVNCAALPANLIESTLFGHEKGAFTGAVNTTDGYFGRANGGTLFLDEVAELSMEAQAKLLRVIETQGFEKVGAVRQEQVDVRVITASHKPLKECVSAGAFRKDLYFRISSFPLLVPPLRMRKEDIIPLSKTLLKELKLKLKISFDGYAKSFQHQLLKYEWPGNVRELKNELEKALILCGGKKLKLCLEEDAFTNSVGIKSFDEEVVAIVRRALDAAGGRVQGVGGAAELLDMKAQTLYSKIRKYGIDY